MAPLFSGGFIADVARSIRVCCGRQPDRKALDRVAQFAARIARQRLSGRLHAAAEAREVSIDQQALSIISELFVGESPNIRLCQALQDELEADDLTLFLKFQAVVVRSATQELFHRWREIDPQSAKLWRNLSHRIKNDPRLLVFPIGKPRYVELASANESNLKPRLFEYDDLRTFLPELVDTGTSLNDQVVNLLAHEESSDECLVARIEDLFKVFRELIFSQANDQMRSEADLFYQNPLMEIAIEKATESARNLLEDCLERYKKDGKFDSDTCNKLAQALLDMVKDCADGDPAMSYFEYARQQMQTWILTDIEPNIGQDFEYLAEQARKEYFDVLRRELGE